MSHKSEAPHNGGATRNSCGGCFRERTTPTTQYEQPLCFQVRQYVPDAQGEDLEHRIALLKARDYAASHRTTCVSDRAYYHACEVHELAGEFVFASVSLARLEEAVKYCHHMMIAALFADNFDGLGARK